MKSAKTQTPSTQASSEFSHKQKFSWIDLHQDDDSMGLGSIAGSTSVLMKQRRLAQSEFEEFLISATIADLFVMYELVNSFNNLCPRNDHGSRLADCCAALVGHSVEHLPNEEASLISEAVQ